MSAGDTKADFFGADPREGKLHRADCLIPGQQSRWGEEHTGFLRLGPTQGGGYPPRGGGSRGTQKVGVKNVFDPEKGPKIYFPGRTQSGRGFTHPTPPPGGGTDLKKKPASASPHKFQNIM